MLEQLLHLLCRNMFIESFVFANSLFGPTPLIVVTGWVPGREKMDH